MEQDDAAGSGVKRIRVYARSGVSFTMDIRPSVPDCRKLRMKGMMSRNNQFDRVVAKMPVLLEALESSAPLKRHELQHIPQRGVYVFYERDVPVYVGRSNPLRLLRLL